MLSRTTQTNEPARCSVLLPVLARLRQPLALLEVGASAGLCLLPDRYGYDYGTQRIEPANARAPVFPCKVTGQVLLPETVPHIVWRRGLDLNPIDLRPEDGAAWLENSVWPGQQERTQRLRAAITIARRELPTVVKGDLLTDLEPLAATAPQAATLVVFHTAVLAYVATRIARDRFAEAVGRTKAIWISNEAPSVFPSFAERAPPAPTAGSFLLAVGRQATGLDRPAWPVDRLVRIALTGRNLQRSFAHDKADRYGRAGAGGRNALPAAF